MMGLKYVNLSTDVYFVCLNHAMSTDGEEIVGLLVGEVDENQVAHVSAVVILRRSDKRKDRVEISPEQLSNASTEAERLACILKRPIRVIGWYHSHPKLTVWPSPIDVNTQDSYQLMDEGFIGMIFSVFNEDPSKNGGRIQMTCFQSQTIIEDCNIEKKRLDIPIHLVPASFISTVCMNALIQLPRFLCQEEQLAYQLTNQVELDYLTRLHNSSVYLKAMGQIAEVICGPLLKMLEERVINNEMKRKKLQDRKKELMLIIEQVHKENCKSKIEQLTQVQLKDIENIEPPLKTDLSPHCDPNITQDNSKNEIFSEELMLCINSLCSAVKNEIGSEVTISTTPSNCLENSDITTPSDVNPSVPENSLENISPTLIDSQIPYSCDLSISTNSVDSENLNTSS